MTLDLAQRGAGYPAAVAALEAYEPTAQAVLDRLRDDGDGDRFAALVAHLGDFWYASGRRRRAIERCDQALALATNRTVARARVLTHAAGVRSTGELVANRWMLDEAIEILTGLGETEPQTWAALFLVVSHDAAGDLEAGARWIEHARVCAGGDAWSQAVVDVFAATHHAWCGDPAKATEPMERAYRTFLELGDGSWQARSQWILAMYRRALGEPELARQALQRAMVHADAAGDVATAEHARFGLVRMEPEPTVAVPALRWCIERFVEIGDVTCEASARRELRRILERVS
jgi:tetratricopeptide (TPR) repeat protein